MLDISTCDESLTLAERLEIAYKRSEKTEGSNDNEPDDYIHILVK